MKLTRKITITLIVFGSILLLLIAVIILLTLNAKKTPASQTQAPPFSALLPQGKTDKALNGKTITAPGGEQTYQFSDIVDGIAINVSEQKLPASFSSDGSNGALKKFAEGFNATAMLTVDGVTVYTGTSAQGPEWAIFARKDLLIIIRATSTLSDTSWKHYISAMK